MLRVELIRDIKTKIERIPESKTSLAQRKTQDGDIDALRKILFGAGINEKEHYYWLFGSSFTPEEGITESVYESKGFYKCQKIKVRFFVYKKIPGSYVKSGNGKKDFNRAA